MMFALDVIFQVELHVIAKIIEAEFVVLTVGNVAVIGLFALLIGEAVDDHSDAETEKIIDMTHPFGVTASQIVIDGHYMDASPGQGVEHRRQSCDKRLALAGL